jgi:hypothetical protein
VGARATWVLAGLLLGPPTSTDDPKVRLELELPKSVQRGAVISAVFRVSNQGTAGLYFKRPWKWAANGMRVEAVNEAGARFTSSTVLYDIERASVCTHFKALAPEEAYTFKEQLDATSQEGLPALIRHRAATASAGSTMSSTTMRTNRVLPAVGGCSADARPLRKRRSSSNERAAEQRVEADEVREGERGAAFAA